MRVRFAVLKRAILRTLCVVVAGATAVPLPAQDLSQLASSLADSISASGRKTAAVADFTDLQGNATELGRFLAEELSAHLVSGAKGFAVIDRTQLKSMLRERGLASTGLMDPQTARKVGQMAGADAIVTATLTPLAAGIRIAAKVIDPSTARVLGASIVEVPKSRAVAELMDRDARPPVAAGSAYLSPNPGLPRLISASENDLLFSVDNCQKSAEGILCMGSITSKYQTRRSIRLGAVLVDAKGNQYQAPVQIGSGREANATELWPKLPARFTVRARGVTADVGDITLILSYTLWSEQGDRGAYVAWTKVALRNIPLSIPGS